MSTNNQGIDYKTHILIGAGVRLGVMEVIADWPHAPSASGGADTDRLRTHEPHVTFVLCTPTSIMPAEPECTQSAKTLPLSRFGPQPPVRRP